MGFDYADAVDAVDEAVNGITLRVLRHPDNYTTTEALLACIAWTVRGIEITVDGLVDDRLPR